MTRELPMFPLGTVLLPHMVLPLHVFEPRYRALMHDVLPADREFGIVRVREGSEVGGGDARDDIGTVARVLQAQELDDGRWVIVTVGTRRIRVERWLEDAPYPRALVHELAEDAIDAATLARRDELVRRLRRLLAQRAELGLEAASSTFELADEAATSCWQLIVLAPIDVHATRTLLATDGWDQRLEQLGRTLAPLESGATLGLSGN